MWQAIVSCINRSKLSRSGINHFGFFLAEAENDEALPVPGKKKKGLLTLVTLDLCHVQQLTISNWIRLVHVADMGMMKSSVMQKPLSMGCTQKMTGPWSKGRSEAKKWGWVDLNLSQLQAQAQAGHQYPLYRGLPYWHVPILSILTLAMINGF